MNDTVEEPPWASTSAEEWTARYENLRSQVLQNGVLGGGWGLVVFLRRGLVDWMRAWPRTVSDVGGRSPADDLPIARPVSLLCGIRQQLVVTLVDMVLSLSRKTVEGAL